MILYNIGNHMSAYIEISYYTIGSARFNLNQSNVSNCLTQTDPENPYLPSETSDNQR